MNIPVLVEKVKVIEKFDVQRGSSDQLEKQAMNSRRTSCTEKRHTNKNMI